MEISNKEIIENIEKLGLSNYEARAYVCLLQNGSSYGNQISKKSGIPSAKIYDILSKLIQKGLVYPIEGNPVYYHPLPFKEFLNNKKKESEEIFSFLFSNQNNIQKAVSADIFWHITGRKNLWNKAREIIDKAEDKILISLWEKEASKLKDCLEKAEQRGVQVYSILYGEIDLKVGKVFKHYMVPKINELHESEMFLLSDNREGMFMFFDKFKGWVGFYTISEGLLRIIGNYLRHDIYLNRMTYENYDLIIQKYGKNMEKMLI
ncbi:MAG TPA: TrmB family transcriptional regulator [Clostridia bacterium]|nr:TrmB family transcriptional regulator [Clostridia bacterium]